MSNEIDEKKIQGAIREKYAQVSRSAAGKFNYPTGRDGAIQQGYDPTIIQSIPDELIESFCGVGNPFRLGIITSGETILDVGCGWANRNGKTTVSTIAQQKIIMTQPNHRLQAMLISN